MDSTTLLYPFSSKKCAISRTVMVNLLVEDDGNLKRYHRCLLERDDIGYYLIKETCDYEMRLAKYENRDRRLITNRDIYVVGSESSISTIYKSTNLPSSLLRPVLVSKFAAPSAEEVNEIYVVVKFE